MKDKKREILDAAFALFAQQGDDFSMAELGDRVGIRAPSLYSHFRSKEEIVRQIIREEVARSRLVLEQSQAAWDGGTCRQKLRGCFDCILRYFTESDRLGFWKHLMLIHSGELKTYAMNEMIAQNAWFRRLLEQDIAEGVRSGELCPDAGDPAHRGAVCLFYSMILGLMDMMLLAQNSDFGFEKYGELTWQAFWRSIGADGAEPAARS